MSLDWNYILSVLPAYYAALLLTLKLSSIGILFALIIGMGCSIIVFYKIKYLSHIAQIYIALFRNTPLVIHLFFMFYALPKIGIVLPAQTVAIIGLALIGGSYMAETFAGSIQAIAHSQVEAGLAIGFNRRQMARYIIFPQACSYSIPMLGANCIFLIKETSVFSIITLMELMNTTKTLNGLYYKSNESYLLLIGAYMLILIPFSILLSWIEKKVRHAEFGN